MMAILVIISVLGAILPENAQWEATPEIISDLS